MAEVKDNFSKLSKFIHPSKDQIEKQLENYSKGHFIGFESIDSFTEITKFSFRTYDLVLTMVFTGFGKTMPADLFDEIFNKNTEWKFHKGKYVSKYIDTLN